MVGHPLNFIISKVQLYVKKEEPDCFSLPNGGHVLSRLQLFIIIIIIIIIIYLYIYIYIYFFFFATDANGYPPAQRTNIYFLSLF